EGIAPDMNAAALGLVELNADFGDAAIAAAGEVLPTNDAPLFEVGEGLVEPVTIGAAAPGGLGGALLSPEQFQFRRRIGAQGIGVFALLADIVDDKPDLVAWGEAAADHGGQRGVNVSSQVFVGFLSHDAYLAPIGRDFHVSAHAPIFRLVRATGLWR